MHMWSRSIEGSILSPGNNEILKRARNLLNPIKDYKLRLRHDKNNSERHGGTAYVSNIFEHTKQELFELQVAIEKGNLDMIMEEAADTVNCVEILIAAVIKEEPADRNYPCQSKECPECGETIDPDVPHECNFPPYEECPMCGENAFECECSIDREDEDDEGG